MIDYVLILTKHYAGKRWALVGDSYDGLIWSDSSPQPTQAELDSLWQSTQDAAEKAECKVKAKSLLAASDWSVLPDVGLSNSSAFISYRATLRELVINPVANPTFPTEPQAVWS